LPPEDTPIFFSDASLGRRVVPDALRAAGVALVVHDDVFPPGTPDQEWLREAGQNGWIVLTKDKKIRYRDIERRALEEARVGAFVLTGKNLTGDEMGRAFVSAIPRMLRVIRKTTRPFLATVSASGAVSQLLPPLSAAAAARRRRR